MNFFSNALACAMKTGNGSVALVILLQGFYHSSHFFRASNRLIISKSDSYRTRTPEQENELNKARRDRCPNQLNPPDEGEFPAPWGDKKYYA